MTPRAATIANRIAPFWVLALVAASLQPWRPRVHLGGLVHSLPQFLAYFATAILLFLAARTAAERNRAPFIVIALGSVIDHARHFLYGTPFDWRDPASNASAALLACLLLRLRLPRASPPSAPGAST